MRTIALAALAVILATGCGIDSRRGATTMLDTATVAHSAVHAEEFATAVVAYVDGDNVATAALTAQDGPIAYADEVIAAFADDLAQFVSDVVTQYPDKMLRFKEQMKAGRSILIDYSKRSGKPIPKNVLEFNNDMNRSIRIVEDVIKSGEERYRINDIVTAVEAYQLMRELIR